MIAQRIRNKARKFSHSKEKYTTPEKTKQVKKEIDVYETIDSFSNYESSQKFLETKKVRPVQDL